MATKITPGAKALVDALQADLVVAKKEGYGLKTVAAEMDRSYSWAAEMVRGEQPFPLARLDTWVRLTGGMNLAHWVAEQVDCDLVLRVDDDLETTLIRAVKESSDATQSASMALLDGEVSEEELEAYEKEMKEAIENFRRLDRALQSRRNRQRCGPVTLAEAEGRDQKT